MSPSNTAIRAIEAYGGFPLWTGAARLQAQVSVTGLAFTLKRRPFFDHAMIDLDIRRPYSRLAPIGRNPGIAGVLDGADVHLEDRQGVILKQRGNARNCFGSLRRLFRWDDLDMSYFANYAFWNYFTLPVLLMRDDIDWRELEPGLLEACFPPEIPTHCRVQRFHFDRGTGLLRQHDYTADVIGGFARAANQVLAHATNEDGLVYPSARRVTPRGPGNRPMKGPVLIDIQVHAFTLLPS